MFRGKVHLVTASMHHYPMTLAREWGGRNRAGPKANTTKKMNASALTRQLPFLMLSLVFLLRIVCPHMPLQPHMPYYLPKFMDIYGLKRIGCVPIPSEFKNPRLIV